MGDTKIIVKTAYPADGNIKIDCKGKKKLALRIPDWCGSFTLNCEYDFKDGYAYVKAKNVELVLDMPIKCIAANPKVHENAGRIAVTRGPVVYCGECIDNPFSIHSMLLDPKEEFDLGDTDFLVPSLNTEAYLPRKTDALYFEANDEFDKKDLKLIPYFAFANRGESDMLVWIARK